MSRNARAIAPGSRARSRDPSPWPSSHPYWPASCRIVTNPRVFARPSSLDDALAFTEAVLAAPAAVVPAVSGRLPGLLVDVCRTAGATADRVPDAYLCAIALDLDAELVTADRGFARYPGLRWRHPLD